MAKETGETLAAKWPARRARWAGSAIGVVVLWALGALPAMAQPGPPTIGEMLWQKDEARCSFVRADAEAPEAAEGNVGRYVFVTELASDSRISIERGYMRIDGLLRELEFLDERSEAEGRIRRYRTFGDSPLSVALELAPASENSDAALEGSIAVANDARATIIGVKGDCRS